MRNEAICKTPALSTLTQLARRSGLALGFALGLGLLAGGTTATAQDLDDFRRAAAADGVNVIPFESLRREAASIAREVAQSKAASQWNFAAYEKRKNKLLDGKAKQQQKIETLRKDIEAFKDKHEDVDVSSLEKDLTGLGDELEDIDDKIDDLNDKLEDGAEAWKRLWNARGGLRELFDDAKDDVRSAQSNLEKYLGDEASEDDRKKLKGYLEVIEDEIELGERTHKEQEDGAKATEEKFRRLIKKTAI